ncbi:jg10651 [Pararge aegeria aegeria]|uniref:Jg10651 protein n=1 Tax=Pararge aegeria aegeria TaxID=348720 RepID=A0A8S4RUJ8_9NEOP|nr:jg10651 [Pararge aegeria aegeria]
MSSALKSEGVSSQNSKSTAHDHAEDNGVASLKRKNFVKACELVSQKAYLNYAERFQLLYMPVCMDRDSCIHASTKPGKITEIPLKVTRLLNIEMEASNWCGALEVCIMSITPIQYLSDVVLKEIVEIMLNAHEDLSSGYTISQVLDKCELVLALNFSTHCPCLNTNIRKVYTNFLTSPMDSKDKTSSNRTQFGSEEGIVNFCLNRLEYEISADSSDGGLLDKTAETPEELRQTIKGLFYQKKQFEIFEMLDRTERINRLMAVLHSIVELIQFDLAIWQSILNSDHKKQLRGNKMLMAYILGQNNCLVTENCSRILKIFSYFIHLDYPEEHIKTMTLWLNAVMEVFFMDQPNANINYPSIGRSSIAVINEFYDIISDLPPKSIIKILERIKPAHIRHQISHHHSNNLLSSDEKETLRILIDFVKNTKWKDLPTNERNTSEDVLVTSSLDSRSCYAVSDTFVKMYRQIFEMLKELIWTINEMESRYKSQEILRVLKSLFDWNVTN